MLGAKIISFSLLVAVVLSADVCQQDCTSEKKEICGSDGKTYVNACHFGIESCRAHAANKKVLYEVHSGECSNLGVHKQLKACTQICDEELDPVCGSNNQVYENPCKFRRAQCQYANENKHLAMVSSTTTSCPKPRPVHCDQYKQNTSGLAIEQSGFNLISCPRHHKGHSHNQNHTTICASNNHNYYDECELCYHIELLKSRNTNQVTSWMILHDGKCKRGVSFNPFGINLIG
ncbi:hypothetical protein LOTGIDRAFT_170607 [Lottia gigantea]|uniref:Kazal-like domain-containing protein n=1 Tax=Lottia gigantea TaxID=225164 RepID=V4BAT5_LOTGI|nr:hypothetical protein LOTGIDRAFT_170607 [Lottia gigantea]ESP04636.1 hypothetical protein LOTGIDRAFT_170607 [Lottia gigantea]